MTYPALDIHDVDGELVLAVADDYSPTGVEEHDGSLTIFFSDRQRRDGACEAIARRFPNARVTAREVDDEDWARRSQENLGSVAVGRLIIAPPWTRIPHAAGGRLFLTVLPPAPLSIVIRPSMAFGTGHHATTRLCLAALQLLNLADTFVLDVGTGSGVLAIAARMLGASGALGIDTDPDAIRCARENLQLNPSVNNVTFELVDFAEHAARLTPADARPDVVTANLSGALLCRIAPTLARAFGPGGALIVSGVLADEQAAVAAAFPDLDVVWEQTEDEWVGMGFARFER